MFSVCPRQVMSVSFGPARIRRDDSGNLDDVDGGRGDLHVGGSVRDIVLYVAPMFPQEHQ